MKNRYLILVLVLLSVVSVFIGVKDISLDPFVWYVTSGGITGTEKMLDEVEEALK